MTDEFDWLSNLIRGGQETETVDLRPEIGGSVVEASGKLYFRHACYCDEDEYHPRNNADYNQRFSEWIQKCETNIQTGDWWKFMHCYAKPFWPEALDAIKARTAPERWARAVRDAWVFSDHLWINYDKWRAAFADRAALTGFMEPEESAALNNLHEILTLYRGCEQRNVGGLSWSLKPEIALGFEPDNETGETFLVVKGFAQRTDVIAYIANGDESEIIIYPEHVSGKCVVMENSEPVDEYPIADQ